MMHLHLSVLKLRVLAFRSVLAMGLDCRQLLKLPYPLNRETVEDISNKQTAWNS